MCRELVGRWFRHLHALRDTILPILEGKAKPLQVDDVHLGANFRSLKRALEVGQSAYKTEEDRRSVIQSKASTIIGFTGVTLTILGLRSDLTNGTRGLPTWIIILAGSLMAITLLYFVVAILCAARVLLVSGHAVVSLESMTPAPTESEELYISRLARQYWLATQANSYYNDRRTDFLILAQLYLRNGVLMLIAVVTVFGLALPLLSRTTSSPKMAFITEEEWKKHEQRLGVSETGHVALEQRLAAVERRVSTPGVSSGDLQITTTNVSSTDTGTVVTGTVANTNVLARTAVVQIDILGQDGTLVSSVPIAVDNIPSNGFQVFTLRLPFKDSDQFRYQANVTTGF